MKSLTWIAGVVVLAACSDMLDPSDGGPGRATRVPPAVASARNETADGAPELKHLFNRYVALGTSVSMGWQSDGVRAASQAQSWPAQLSAKFKRTLTQPYISGFGCRAPLAAPLASGVRISGEAAAQPAASAQCEPLEPEVELPVRNVAISGATTLNALSTTPETHPDAFYQKLYPRVLPPGQTQLSVMQAIDPTFVSVEFGANEVLVSRSGIAIPGATIFPFTQWTQLYTALVDAARAETQFGVLVGLINDAATFPGFRRGSEIWADRLTLLGGFNVSVDANCDASANLIFVPVRVPTAVAAGLAARQNGLPPVPFSCADGGTGVQDFVLTPAEAAIVNGQMQQMTAFISAAAARIGYATFDLEALYGRADLKPPFSTVQLMTSAQPYGPYISLDGIHPNAAGHAVLAEAAVRAINTLYGVPHPLPVVAGRN